jgi:hypothetical protein
MKTTDIRFDEFRELLFGVGFGEVPQKTRKYFKHPAGSILLFRLYKDREKVSLRDLMVVRGQLEDQGVIAATDFDRLLQK